MKAAQRSSQAFLKARRRGLLGRGPQHRAKKQNQKGIGNTHPNGGALSRPSIIAIAGSAGAIEALLTIVSGLPHDFDVSVFIVVHRTAKDGRLAEVLARKTRMRVITGRNGERMARRTIYVGPPDFHLTVGASRMFLSKGPKVNRHRPAIDKLFESAASAFNSRLIGVLLSGYLDDGTAGLAAIKKNGGITVVQDPADSLAPSMPRSALAHVDIDHCVQITEIAPLLVRLVSTTERAR